MLVNHDWSASTLVKQPLNPPLITTSTKHLKAPTSPQEAAANVPAVSSTIIAPIWSNGYLRCGDRYPQHPAHPVTRSRGDCEEPSRQSAVPHPRIWLNYVKLDCHPQASLNIKKTKNIYHHQPAIHSRYETSQQVCSLPIVRFGWLPLPSLACCLHRSPLRIDITNYITSLAVSM